MSSPGRDLVAPLTRLTREERRLLLRTARQTVTLEVAGQRVHDGASLVTTERSGEGAFVTLHVAGELRGCIGQVGEAHSLVDTVRRLAAAAAVDDPRFPPVTPAELSALVIEISVLGPLVPCRGPEDVEIRRHGLLIEKGRRHGVLLPQVAVEKGWDPDAFVAAVCRKAGLPPDAWGVDASLFVFEADVFSEADGAPRGSRRP